MKLDKIDLSNLIAVGHDNNRLGLLFDRGEEIEYVEVIAPQAAYEGLQQVAALANEEIPAFAIKALESSCAAAIGYDRDRHNLQVEFTNGATYEYAAVEPEIWQEFCEAESPGQFYNSNIKGLYRSQRLD
jgi:hypothetical protein